MLYGDDPADGEYADGPDEDDSATMLRVFIGLTKDISVDGKIVHTATLEKTHAESQLIRRIVDDAVKAAVKEALEDDLRKRVDDLIAAEVAEVVKPRVSKLLDEGWQTFDTYGNRGKVVTLPEKVAAFLEAPGDRYDNRGSVLQGIVKEKTAALLDQKFRAQLDEATKGFRKTVDDLLAGSIASSLRAALGLK